MSAWLVWSALGLYPLPGTDKYFLGSPAIDAATLHFDSGMTLILTPQINTFILFPPKRYRFKNCGCEQQQEECHSSEG